jgi:hypothetical protein
MRGSVTLLNRGKRIIHSVGRGLQERRECCINLAAASLAVVEPEVAAQRLYAAADRAGRNHHRAHDGRS